LQNVRRVLPRELRPTRGRSLNACSNGGRWRGRRRRRRGHDLIKRFAVADHSQFAAGTFFKRRESALQIRNFRCQLAIALALFAVRTPLCFKCGLQARNFTFALIGDPQAILKQQQCNGERGSENPHGDSSLALTLKEVEPPMHARPRIAPWRPTRPRSATAGCTSPSGRSGTWSRS
jgi:hypothetical protein